MQTSRGFVTWDSKSDRYQTQFRLSDLAVTLCGQDIQRVVYAPTEYGTDRWIAYHDEFGLEVPINLWREDEHFYFQQTGSHLPYVEGSYQPGEFIINIRRYSRKWGLSGIKELYVDGKPIEAPDYWQQAQEAAKKRREFLATSKYPGLSPYVVK